MKANELKDGDYFQSLDGNNTIIVGRRVDKGLYWFDLATTKGLVDIGTAIENWHKDVSVISFQAFLTLLVEQCTQQNQPIEEIDKENKIPAKELKPGQFFIDPEDNNIGRRFQKPRSIVVYWTLTPYQCLDDFPDISAEFVIPITLQQAVIFQLSNLLHSPN